MGESHRISVTVNDSVVEAVVPGRLSLADWLRGDLGLTGTNLGCEHGACGVCTVLLDGRSVRSCLLLAVQADGRSITTVEGLAIDGELNRLQAEFAANHALQCGFCTPGMLMTAVEYIAEGSSPDRDAIRERLSGNLCRCTGYQNIVTAVALAIGGAVR